MNSKYDLLFKNLINNNIKPIYAENKEKVKEIVKEILFDNATITNGGSISVSECGIFDIIKNALFGLCIEGKIQPNSVSCPSSAAPLSKA